MTALSSSPLAPVLARLVAEADAADTAFFARRDEFPADIHLSADYRRFYALAKTTYLAVSPETGRLLYLLARAAKATSIIEFGASFGISTLHLAAALKDNGGGELITTEFEADKAATLRRTLAEAGIAELVDLREGDALETLASGLPDAIDLVLLDGAKPLYPAILDLLAPRFVAGTLIVADNAEMSPDYLKRVRAAGSGFLSVPFAADVELSQWLG